LPCKRLRRNKALTADDLLALEQMLLESGAGDDKAIAQAREEAHGLGLLIRSLVGLDRQAAMEAFVDFPGGTQLSTNQRGSAKWAAARLQQRLTSAMRSSSQPSDWLGSGKTSRSNWVYPSSLVGAPATHRRRTSNRGIRLRQAPRRVGCRT
jgi:hypothetical protein